MQRNLQDEVIYLNMVLESTIRENINFRLTRWVLISKISK